jgi:uncharacterized protein
VTFGLDRDGRSPLHYAAEAGDLDATLHSVNAGADVRLADRRGWTALHFAAQARAADVAATLLEAGAEVDSRDENGNTPLWRAVFESRGDGAVIRLLREHGANPNIPNARGISPAGLARSIANFDVAQYFADVSPP